MADEPIFDEQAVTEEVVEETPSPFVPAVDPDDKVLDPDVTADVEEPEAEVVEQYEPPTEATVVLNAGAVPEGAEDIKVSVGGVDVEFPAADAGVVVSVEDAAVLAGSDIVDVEDAV